MNLKRIAIPADLNHTGQGAHGCNTQRTHAAYPTPRGAGFDFRRSPFRNNLPAIDHYHAVGERIRSLYKDPSQYYPNTDEGREQLLGYLRERLEGVKKRLPMMFDHIPDQVIEEKASAKVAMREDT